MRGPLYDALDALANAHGVAEMMAALRQMRRANRQVRRQEDQGIGTLAASVLDALDIRDKLKADGATGDALNAGLEAVLRDTWPKARLEPWHSCKGCGDYGLEMRTCAGDATCGRSKPHLAHDYGVPCWCPKGQRFREKPKPSPDDVTGAGKAPKGGNNLRRFGR